MKDIKLGCCLFTVSDEFAKDPYGTLYALKDMGYSYIETANFIHSTSQWKGALARSGLSIASVHINIEYQEVWQEHIMEFCDSLGNRYIVYPALRKGREESAKGFLQEAGVMNKLGKTYKERGYTMMYHNHAFEFKKFKDGKCGMDILLENTDPDLVKFQFDTYWLTFGGENAVEFIKKNASRCAIIHLKDMNNEKDRKICEVGEGIIDFKEIIQVAQEAKIKYMLVEQDYTSRPQMESAQLSYNNLQKIIATL